MTGALLLTALLLGSGSIAQQAYVKASNTDPGDEFGRGVAISGDTLIVGAPGEDSNAFVVDGNQSFNGSTDAGAAYVFVRSGTTWAQQAYLKPPNNLAGSEFGGAVAIDGDQAVVGAPKHSSISAGAGAAYIFERTGTTWSHCRTLLASNFDTLDEFGSSVAISGDTVVVGAPREASNALGVGGDQSNDTAPSAGAAYVFVPVGTAWFQQAYLKASNTDPNDRFGCSVSISGDTIAVGALTEDSAATGANGLETNAPAGFDSGATYVFTRAGVVWSQQAYIKASNTDAGDLFGNSVALSGNTLVVGAAAEDSAAIGIDGLQSDNSASASGAAYVFVRSGLTWSQEAYIKASNTDAGDEFGNPVSIEGDGILVGAAIERGNATGIDGDESNNSFGQAGAAYYFERVGTSWDQAAYVKASNTNTFDRFGASVSIDGTSAVVGARFESSSATGIDGDESNNSSASAGAVYIFDLDAPRPGPPNHCFGDGGDQLGCTDCPCGNNAVPGTIGGCLNSASSSAQLIASGDASVSLPAGATTDLRFSLSGAPGPAFSILNSSDAVAPANPMNPCFGMNSGAQAMQFDGLRCAVMNTRRHGGRSADSMGNIGVTNNPWGGEGPPALGLAVAGGGFVAGQTRFFQVVQRDDPLMVCMRGLNTSQAIEITFTP